MNTSERGHVPEQEPFGRLSAFDWQTLRDLTDRIDSDPDAIGVRVTPERGEDGITHVGYVRYGKVVTDFFEFVDAHELLIRFDWPGGEEKTQSHVETLTSSRTQRRWMP